MTGGKGIRVQAMAVLLVLAVCAPAFALGQFCIIKGGNTAAPTGTPCADAVADFNSGGKTLVHFNDGCTAPKVFDMVFEQEPGNLQAVGGIQASLAYDPAQMSDPTCTMDPENFFADSVGLECPGFHMSSGQTYVFGGKANVSADYYPLNRPNVIAMSVSFATFSIAEGATGTLTHFTAAASKQSKIVNTDAEDISSLVNADVSCGMDAPVFVNAPANVSYSYGNVQDCTTDACPMDFSVSYDLPTQCRFLENTVPCNSVGCTPGVTVLLTSPTAATLAEHTTNTSVTTPLDLTDGPFTFQVYGTCYSGDRTGTPVAMTTIVPPVLNPQFFTSVSLYGNSDSDDVSLGHPACGQILTGMPIPITGSLDGANDDTQLTLLYGHESTAPVFPQQIQAVVNEDGKFSIEIPGVAVEAGAGVYWALRATDLVTGLSAYYPSDYAQTTQTAARFSGDCIVDTPKAFQARQPYPDQMPFQAGHGRPLVVDFALSEQADIYFSIYTVQGREVRRIMSSSADPHIVANTCHWEKGCSWDGTDSGGGLVGNGLYIINLHVTGTGQHFGGQTFDYTKGLVVMK